MGALRKEVEVAHAEREVSAAFAQGKAKAAAYKIAQLEKQLETAVAAQRVAEDEMEARVEARLALHR
eukprot:COSAG01_NODE_8967_length_2600_cov_1.761295_1_plen_67_part_00